MDDHYPDKTMKQTVRKINMPSTNLDKLRDLTEKLTFQSSSTYSPAIRQNAMARGTSLSFGLLNEPAISCAKVFASKGSCSPLHSHAETEFFLVYEGMMVVFMDGLELVLHAGECLSIHPGVEHSAEFPDSECWLLAITIPQTTGWPDAPEGGQNA